MGYSFAKVTLVGHNIRKHSAKSTWKEHSLVGTLLSERLNAKQCMSNCLPCRAFLLALSEGGDGW